MRANSLNRIRYFNPSYTVPAATGLGLALIISFTGFASADDVVFGFAAGMGGTGDDHGLGIAVDSSGSVYTTGSFEGTADFDPGTGTANLTSAGGQDIFVTKLNSAGNFLWVKAIGGSGTDEGFGIAVDASGNVYTTGSFESTVNFDPGAGMANLTSAGGQDIFVTKLNSVGNFLWARAMGGIGTDFGLDIAVDVSGNVYTTGWFEGTVDFNPGAGMAYLTSAGGINSDIFVTKLDSAGNFLWAKAMGDTSNDWGEGIAVDSSGNVYATGSFEGTADFDPGAGTANLISAGGQDIFITKLSSVGNFLWAKAMGGNFLDTGRGIVVDSSGKVYTTGFFVGTADFDPDVGTANLSSAGGSDIFVTKLDSAGNFVWAKAMGGTSDDWGLGIALDASGRVYTTGSFEGTADFDPGAGTANLTSAGGINSDIFVTKLDSAGNFMRAKAMGASDGFGDVGLGIAVDSAGNVYTTGFFEGTADFNPGAGTANLTSAGGINRDIFVTKLDVIAIWVDFGFIGIEDGSYDNPFKTLAEGLAAAPTSTTVKIKGNTGDSVSNQTMTINQAVRIEAVNGAVRIGDPGGRNSKNGRQSGFLSRN